MTSLSFNQLRAQVAAVRKKYSDTTAIAIRTAHRWTGESKRVEPGETFWIHQCDSPLAMRVALRQQNQVCENGRFTSILITDLDDEQIGDDILVRLKPRKVVPLDNWQIVKSLFQAREIDPRVTQHHWIAAALMDYGALSDYPPATSGFLDAETIWKILLTQMIGLESDTPDLLSLLKWSTSATNVKRWQSLASPIRDAASEWIVGLAGTPAAAVLRAARENEKPDALPIGLAIGVVLHPRAQGKLEKASGKLEERYLSGKTLSAPVIAAWHAAASDVVRLGLSSDGRLKQQLLARGDEILHEVGGDSYAWLSETSSIGFDQRLARFGDQLCTVQNELKSGVADLEGLAEARESLLTHDRTARERRRVDRVQMAMRLVRWLLDRKSSTECSAPGSLAEAALRHLREGGFVDWARLTLRSGDPVRELSEAYAKLFDQVTAICETRSQQFAELLKDWTASHVSDSVVIPVEEILDRVVAPLAEHGPLLVVVMDGMSVAVFRELMDDVLGDDWVLLAEESIGLRCGLATIPSVTEVSRTSLLCGKLSQGSSPNEKSGFAGHPALGSACRSTHPPILFHKASLQESEDASLAADIRKEIGSAHRKIVGVVVNAVDDHLLKGEQIDTRWTRDEIKVLPALLREAKMSRRTVILLSDHGHVLDCNAKGKNADGGERWRIDNDDPCEGELQISGPRVVMPELKDRPSTKGVVKVIAPWTEKLRYGIKKNGYHGGVTPQEMVVPVAVLSTSDSFPKGWNEATVDLPTWWNESLKGSAEPEQPPPVIKPQPKKAPETLFDLVDEDPLATEAGATSSKVITSEQESTMSVNPPWITALLASDIFARQKQLGGRSVPANEVFAKLLTALDSHGGKMTSMALAGTTGLSPTRLRGLLAVATRILNIDGYAVLTRDDASDTIGLDRPLLFRQFDLVSG